MAIANLALAAARALSGNLSGNIARRVARVEKMGATNASTIAFRELQKAAQPVTRNEWVKRAAQLQRLNEAPGTRVKSAEQVAKRDSTRLRNEQLRSASADVNTRIRMSRGELVDAARLARADTRRRIRDVRKHVGDNFAARKAEEIANSLNLKGSRNEILSVLSSLEKTKKYKTLTRSGARAMEQAGLEAFGEVYADMDDEQKSAIWRRMESEQVKQSLSSQEVQAMIKAVLNDHYQVAFTRVERPDGTNYLEADFGTTLKEAVAQKARREKGAEMIESYKSDYIEPMFVGIREAFKNFKF